MSTPPDTSETLSNPANVGPLATATTKKPTVISLDQRPVQLGVEPPNLISHENINDFNALKDKVLDYLKPQNIIEEIYVSDFVQLEWEARRLRAISAAMYSAGRPFAVARLLGFPDERFCDSPLPRGQYGEKIEELKNKGYDPKDFNAQTTMIFASIFESLDKRRAVVELRRDQALSKLEDRRAADLAVLKTIDASASPLEA
ncbi:hypothetical protein SAMN05216374_6366 [Tardiphaga sp. OK246]|jgi:hypothetical protein|uniref:hypothetical protein n=1 Tax=unclassified Tardiphaga TaxID=2631404 RepID=UPI000B66C2B4|nr:hypothetical protein [Tardiphaga sp. OK246]SNT63154.1 hypothetical protein SAMN05216374_6366 [Tardiphaga sp. OK246]